MPNEVSIKITADDLSGPAFASAMAKMKALKAMADGVSKDRQIDFGIGGEMARLRAIGAQADSIARHRQIDFGVEGDLSKIRTLNAEADRFARGRQLSFGVNDALSKMGLLKDEIHSMTFGRVDTSAMGASLMALRSKIQSLGIADIADVNIPPGRITTQLQLIKRLIGQSGISDIMDFNMTQGQLAKHMDQLGRMAIGIPVKFDISHVPIMGPKQDIFRIPIAFDMGKMPKFGDTSSIDTESRAVEDLARSIKNVGYASGFSAMSMDEAAIAIARYGRLADQGARFNAFFGSSFVDLARIVSGGAVRAFNGLAYGSDLSAKALSAFSGRIDSGIPLWKAAGGWFGWLGGRLQLFGGWLTKLGAPAWIGTVTGLHILTEGVFELGAVLIPATIAFAAFGAAAVPTIQDITKAEQNMNTVSQALNLQMPGLSNGFQKAADSVRPNVYILMGEALNTINGKTGEFQTLAKGSGRVMDELGARVQMALGNQGLNGFLGHGVEDLRIFGNIVGNVFGIFGNLLKSVPGYAEMAFKGIQDFTGALENITSSGAVQGILRVGLALHGALFYAGLAATGLFALRGPLTAIAVWAIQGVTTIAALSAAFIEEAATAGIAAAAMDTLSLASPWVLAAAGVAVAVAGLVVLVSWLGNSVNAQRAYLNAVESTISAQTTFAGIISVTSGAIRTTNEQLAKTPQYVSQTTMGMHGMVTTGNAVNTTYINLKNNSRNLNTQLGLERDRRKQLISIFGSTTAAQDAMQQAGIKLSDTADANAGAWAKDIVQLKALSTATVQLAGFQNGQAAAAQNALNFMGGTITQIQKITAAEEGLLAIVTGSQNAFDTYGQGLHTLGQDAVTAGASIGGLNNQSFILNQQFINQVDNAQKVIDALQQQSANTHQLTAATATMVGQLVPFAKNNEGARATMVALINNALGPGTVSLKTLNGWVKTNSTTMQGLSNIMAASTLKAGSLAGVLQNQLNKQFHDLLLKTSGADAALQAYTGDLVNSQGSTARGRGDRAQLIHDLEKTGLSAKDATGYVNSLQGQIDSMHGKTVPIYVQTIYPTPTGQPPPLPIYNVTPPGGHAFGGYVGGYGSPTADDKLISVSSGEYVVNARSVDKYGLGLMEMINKGQYASGGYTGGGYGSWSGPSMTLYVEGGQSPFDKFMAHWIRDFVRVKGGGDVQRAFGSRGK